MQTLIWLLNKNVYSLFYGSTGLLQITGETNFQKYACKVVSNKYQQRFLRRLGLSAKKGVKENYIFVMFSTLTWLNFSTINNTV